MLIISWECMICFGRVKCLVYLIIRQFYPVKEAIGLLACFEDEDNLVIGVLRIVLLQEVYEAVA